MEHEIDIRSLLIGRIRELRELKAQTSQGSTLRNLESLELFNTQLYYYIFKRGI